MLVSNWFQAMQFKHGRRHVCSCVSLLLVARVSPFYSLAQKTPFAWQWWVGYKKKVSKRNLSRRNRRERRRLILTPFHLNSPWNCTANQSHVKTIAGDKTWPLILRYTPLETLSSTRYAWDAPDLILDNWFLFDLRLSFRTFENQQTIPK